ncbi:MAG TPA: hypothetical protein VME41_17440 [Stellaceae bacterium]|nr:hypothetical protein [Stellaceae bacterium]
MNNRRGRGVLSGVGAVIVALTLLLSPPAGSADELSELRANSELLQQRIDQIHRVETGAAEARRAAATDGNFPRSFVVPGTDTSISIGGSVGADTGWTEGRPGNGR